MSTHIDFLDVSVFYGDHKALDEVSLSIERNEIFGIVGPANSGKTTLLKAINRTIDLVTGTKVVGEVSIDGQNVNSIKNVHSLRTVSYTHLTLPTKA